jgi:hypothetical protein
MKVNTYDVVERHNRPDVLQRVGLRTLFYNDGVLTDPYEISSVTVFNDYVDFHPSAILSGTTLSTSAADVVLMSFGASGESITSATEFDASNYTPGATASGIYRLGVGDYIVILDGILSLSGNYEGSTVANSVSAVGNYIDVWTVKMVEGSIYKTLINEFELFDDTFFSVTEPLIIKASNNLVNKRFQLGSKQKIHVSTKIYVENKIDDAIRNIFRDSVITEAQFRILKINEGNALAPYVEVSGYSATSSLIQTTSNNDLIFLWDTELLKTHPSLLSGDMSSIKGTYVLQVRYNVLDELIQTPDFYMLVV